MKQNLTPTIVPFLPFQSVLSPALPTVQGNAEYHERVETLGMLNELLLISGVEAEFVSWCMEDFLSQAEAGKPPSHKELERHQTQSLLALRTMVLKSLLQETYRGLSLQLAQSPLLRQFCLCDGLVSVKVPTKSELQRYSQWLPHEQMRGVVDQLTRAALCPLPGACEAVGLECALELDVLFVDSTCLKANIHFPVDWVLLRDATRTLMKSIEWVRAQGLTHRMEAPESFLSRINALCMEMTQVSRAFVADSKNKRKAVLRKMKKVVKAVEGHAQTYRQLLEQRWQETELTQGRVKAALRRMDNILSQLPAAKKQAHERIIGERQVPNAEKILSLYEADLHVMIRGKASGEVEFGNALLVSEQSDGLIVDYELTKEAPRADVKVLQQSISRVDELGCGPAQAVVADRAFDSQENRDWLEQRDLFNGVCPRNPKELQRRSKDDELFGACQKRRAQTEGRLAILKNVYIGARCRAKGFESRQAQVDWAVLTHNLRLLVRLRQQQQKAAGEKLLAAA